MELSADAVGWEGECRMEAQKTEQPLDAELIAFRRDLHHHPEVAWTEYRTTARLIERMERAGITVLYGEKIHDRAQQKQLPDAETDAACLARAEADGASPELLRQLAGGYTGCVAVIEGAKPGPTVALRVDIDALMVEENSAQSHRPTAEGFASCYAGQMHACGHDAHASIGLGTALHLQQRHEELCGRVKILFQPSEEIMRGAASMVGAGLLDDCDYFFGGHVGLNLRETGVFAAGCTGILATSKFNVRFTGKGAHAGVSPQEGHNALAAAACATLNMLAIPRHGEGASRINVGVLHGGTARNVIPEHAELCAETRGLTSGINRFMEESADRVCQAAAEMYGCTCEKELVMRAESAESDPELVSFVASHAGQTPGVQRVEPSAYFGACEDVTLMMARVQSHGGKAAELMYGTAIAAEHHNGSFDLDEAVIPLTARLLTDLILATAKERP